MVQVEKGSEYAITFSAARTCAQLEALNVSAGGVSQTVDLQTLYNIEGWDAYADALLLTKKRLALQAGQLGESGFSRPKVLRRGSVRGEDDVER